MKQLTSNIISALLILLLTDNVSASSDSEDDKENVRGYGSPKAISNKVTHRVLSPSNYSASAATISTQAGAKKLASKEFIKSALFGDLVYSSSASLGSDIDIDAIHIGVMPLANKAALESPDRESIASNGSDTDLDAIRIGVMPLANKAALESPDRKSIASNGSDTDLDASPADKIRSFSIPPPPPDLGDLKTRLYEKLDETARKKGWDNFNGQTLDSAERIIILDELKKVLDNFLMEKGHILAVNDIEIKVNPNSRELIIHANKILKKVQDVDFLSKLYKETESPYLDENGDTYEDFSTVSDYLLAPSGSLLPTESPRITAAVIDAIAPTTTHIADAGALAPTTVAQPMIEPMNQVAAATTHIADAGTLAPTKVAQPND